MSKQELEIAAHFRTFQGILPPFSRSEREQKKHIDNLAIPVCGDVNVTIKSECELEGEILNCNLRLKFEIEPS